MIPIEIICPTRGRLAKIRRMLNSIEAAAKRTPYIITVITDGDPKSAKALEGDPRIDILIEVSQQSGSVYCRNLATAGSIGPLIYVTDDIELFPGAIDAAAEQMKTSFPDGDGVIGFNQGEEKHSPAGVALIGYEFLIRYPNQILFYPGYFHFSCQEIHRAALILGRFAMDPGAKLRHYHPSTNADEADHTHVEAREFRNMDRALSFERSRAGLTWGFNDFFIPNGAKIGQRAEAHRAALGKTGIPRTSLEEIPGKCLIIDPGAKFKGIK